MFTTFKNRAALVRVNAAHKLTRNNLEFAGVVVYFFSLAVAFVMTIIAISQSPSANSGSKAESRRYKQSAR